MIHNPQVWLSLASECRNQINALPAPPPYLNFNLNFNFPPQATPDTVELGTETKSPIVNYDDYDNDAVVIDSHDESYDVPATSVADSSVALKAALTENIELRIKEALGNISDSFYAFIYSLLDKRPEVRIEPINIPSLLWPLFWNKLIKNYVTCVSWFVLDFSEVFETYVQVKHMLCCILYSKPGNTAKQMFQGRASQKT